MKWISLERRFGWLTFPGLFRGITCLHLLVFIVLLMKPETLGLFGFDPERIQAGEYWRIVSHFFLPPILPGSMIAVFFMVFAVLIGFMMNDSLEAELGAFRTSLYLYGLLLFQLVALLAISFIQPALATELGKSGGMNLYQGFFFAFAILFPFRRFLLFFIIPTPVWILGAIGAGMILLISLGTPLYGLFSLISLFPLLIWAVPRLLKIAKNKSLATADRATFKMQTRSAATCAFHTCHTCGKTEQDDPNLAFRVSENGKEYCLQHLPK